MFNTSKEVPELTPQAVETGDFSAGMSMPPTDGSGLFMIPEPEEANEGDIKMPRPKLSVCDHFSLYEQLLQIKRSAIELRSALEHGAVSADGTGPSGTPSLNTMQQLSALAMRTLNEEGDVSTATGSNPSEQLIVEVAKRLRDEQKRLTELQQLIEMTTEQNPGMQALGLSTGPLATLLEAPETQSPTHLGSPDRHVSPDHVRQGIVGENPEMVPPPLNPLKETEEEDETIVGNNVGDEAGTGGTPAMGEGSTVSQPATTGSLRAPVSAPTSHHGSLRAPVEAPPTGSLRAALHADGTLGGPPVVDCGMRSPMIATDGSFRAPLAADGTPVVTGSLRAPQSGETGNTGLQRMSSCGSDLRSNVSANMVALDSEQNSASAPANPPEPISPDLPSVPPQVSLRSPALQSRSASIRALPPSVRPSFNAHAMQAGAIRQGSLPLPRSPVQLPRSPRLSLGRDILTRPGSTSLPLHDVSLSPVLAAGERGPPRRQTGVGAHLRSDSAELVPPVVAALQNVPFGPSRHSLNRELVGMQGPSRASSRDPAALAASLQAAVQNAAIAAGGPEALQPTVMESQNRNFAFPTAPTSASTMRSPPASVPVTPQTINRDTRIQAAMRIRQPRNSLKVSPTPRSIILQATPVAGGQQSVQSPTPGLSASYGASSVSSSAASSKPGSSAYPAPKSSSHQPERRMAPQVRTRAKAYAARQASPERRSLSPVRGRAMTPNPATATAMRMPSNSRQSIPVNRLRTGSPTGARPVAIAVPGVTAQMDPNMSVSSTAGNSITVSAAPNAPVPLGPVPPGVPMLSGSMKAPLTGVRPLPAVPTTTVGSAAQPRSTPSAGGASLGETQKVKEEVDKQKENNSQDLMLRLKRDAEALAQMHKQQEGLLHALANQEKKQFEVIMEQRVQQEEFVLMRQFREQVMRLTQTAQARRAELEKKALEANLAWQQKKVEDVYLEKKTNMEQEYQKAQESLTKEISKLHSKRATSFRQSSPAGLNTPSSHGGSFVAAGAAPSAPLTPQMGSFHSGSHPGSVQFSGPTFQGTAGSRGSSPAVHTPISGMRNIVAVPAVPVLPTSNTD